MQQTAAFWRQFFTGHRTAFSSAHLGVLKFRLSVAKGRKLSQGSIYGIFAAAGIFCRRPHTCYARHGRDIVSLVSTCRISSYPPCNDELLRVFESAARVHAWLCIRGQTLAITHPISVNNYKS